MLTISWVTNGTVQLSTGGDAASSPFHSLAFDIVESDNYEAAVVFSDHSVERGIPVTDNAEPQKERYSVTVNLSERPASLDLVPGSNNLPLVLPDGTAVNVVTPPIGTTRKADAFEQLLELKSDATLVNVEGGLRALEDWAIENVSVPRTIEDAGLLVCVITFVERRVATLEDVDAPSPRVERGRRSSNQGTQTPTQTSTDTPSPAPADRSESGRSAARAIADYFSGGD